MANRRSNDGKGGFQRGENRNFYNNSHQFQGRNNSNRGCFQLSDSTYQELALALSNLLLQHRPSNPSLDRSHAICGQDSYENHFSSNGCFRPRESYCTNKKDNACRSRQEIDRNQSIKPVNRDRKDNKGVKYDGEKNKDSKPKPREEDKYIGVKKALLNCFVCNKIMWDGISFYKHLQGQAHKEMLQCLDQSFHINANMLRERMRLSVEKQLIESDRKFRLTNKKQKHLEESTCNMCDVHFFGNLISHRKTDGHKMLKQFLHPKCNVCSQEFTVRMDWVNHCLTREHLIKLGDCLEKKQEPEDGNEIEGDNEEVIVKGEEVAIKQEEQETESETILELTDSLDDIDNRLPVYIEDRPVGTRSLKAFQGFVCSICNRSFLTEEQAKLHLKSLRHYHCFIEAAAGKQKTVQDGKHDSSNTGHKLQKLVNISAKSENEKEFIN